MEEQYTVYVQVNEGDCVVAITSSAFLTQTEGWVEVERGTGDPYHHAQGNYLPGALCTEEGAPRYKLAGGAIVARSQEEMEADLYLPNDSADGFLVVRETVDATAQGLADALIARGVLPEGTAVESFATHSDGVETREGDMVRYEVGDVSLSLDLSEEFLGALENAGTSGETVVLGSVVNTFLTAYHAVEMTLTCGGAAVETGHGVYDGPLAFFDLPCTQGE